MATLDIHDLGLAVSDLEATTGFFVGCLGWSLAQVASEHQLQGSAKHFIVYEPSGIRMEYIWVP